MKNFNSPSGQTILVAGLLWAITYISCLMAVKELEPSKTLGLFLSFLPVITFAYFIFQFIRGIKAMDELECTIQLEATVIAFTLALLLIMTLGLLDNVVTLKKEDWSYRHLVPYLFLFYFLGLFISRRKYHVDEKSN